MRFLLSLLLLCSMCLHAQNLDSLRSVGQDANLPDSARLQALYKLGGIFTRQSPDSALRYAKAYQKLATAKNASLDQGKAWMMLAHVHTMIGDTALAQVELRKGVALCLEAGEDEVALAGIDRVAGFLLDRDLYPYSRVYYRYGIRIADSVGNKRREAQHNGNLGLSLEFEGYKPEALTHYERSLQLFTEVGDSVRQAWALNAMGFLHVSMGAFDEGLTQLKRSFEIYYAVEDWTSSAGCLANMAGIYLNRGDVTTGLQHFQRALRMLDSADQADPNVKNFQATITGNIGQTYARMEDYEPSFQYHLKALEQAKALGRKSLIAKSYSSLAIVSRQLKDTTKALYYFEKGVEIAKEIGAINLLAELYGSAGLLYHTLHKTEEARRVLKKGLELNQVTGNQLWKIECLITLAHIDSDEKKYRSAQAYAEQALKLSEERGAVGQISRAAKYLYRSQQGLGQYQQALDSYQKHIEARDSLYREENQRATLQFEYDQKALQDSLTFVEQQAETELGYQQQLAQRNYLLFGGLGLAIIISLGIYLWQQRRLRQQELALQQELLNSTILVQEQERERIAKDLHDEVGSKLNVMNLFLHQLTRTVDQAEEGIADVLSVIDETIETTRRISHDLLPPTLEKFGLATAVEELRDRLSQTQGPTLHVEIEGERSEETAHLIELNVYRILQELLNNTWKYAQAENVYIALNQQTDVLSLSYRDDGKGFDPKAMKNQKGLGMQNIRSRLQMIQGQLNLQSAPNKGIQVEVQVPL